MSICNGDVNEMSDSGRPRSVRFGAEDVEDEIVKVSTTAVLEATPISDDFDSSQSRIFIKGGKVVNADQMFDADIYIEDGIIKQVGSNLSIPGGTKVIEAKGKLIMPGGIDPHTHFEMPFMGTRTSDDFYTGTKAALAGGTTMIIDFVIDPTISLLQAYDKWRNMADDKVCCDYGLHVAVTDYNEKIEEEMKILTSEKGINSFKMFMTYEKMQLNDKDLLQVFEACVKLGAIAQVHAENGDIIAHNQKKLIEAGITGPEGHYYSRTEEVEAEAANRAIILASQVHCPLYIVHVMSKSAGDVIAQHRQKGLCEPGEPGEKPGQTPACYTVYGETIAAALGTDGSNYFHKCWRHAAGFVLSPPLSADPTTSTHLFELLSSGTLQVTGSDHCTFNADQKAIGQNDFTKIPNGVNGVEDRMSVVWEKGVMTGLLDPCQFVAVTSTNAAKIFNLYPQKGRIQQGSDADVIVWDPHANRTISSETHHQAVDFNIFEGMKVRGVPVYVISRGKIVVENDQLHVTQGSGRFVPTLPFSPHVFSSMQQRQFYPEPVLRGESDASPVEISSSTTSPPTSAREPVFMQTKGGQEFHSRPPTKSGGRNLQDSSFSLSGAQIDDSKGQRCCVKVNKPPGGHSTGLW